jgi:putative transposase
MKMMEWTEETTNSLSSANEQVTEALSGWHGVPPESGCIMTPTTLNPYRGFRFPAELIQHAVWLYHCFSLSLREAELILASRGIVVSCESIREWGLRFGQMFANSLRRRRAATGRQVAP